MVFSPILEAALGAFHEHGYGGSTVRDIANRVGVTVPALYYHHENKEAMLFALLDQSITRMHGLIMRIWETDTSTRGRLDSMVEILVRHTAVNGRVMFLDSELRSLTAGHREAYVARRDDVEHHLVLVVEDGVELGELATDRPRTDVRAMLGMIQAIADWYRPDGEMTVDDLVDRYLILARRLVGGS